MRKNGVNRKLREISGGVCAPAGFRANGVYCGIKSDPEQKDLAAIVADKRCPTACVFSVSSLQSAPARVSLRHLKNGYARAIVANSGTANLFLENGEVLAETVCRTVAKCSNIDARETLIASTGKVGIPLSIAPFERGLPQLISGLSASEEGSLFAAQAIMTTDAAPKQISYAFELGAISCKIGGIFKGNTRVCPNMATMLIFLTTDVDISSEMLQKALSSAVKDTVNLLSLDGVTSPNDTVCIMASGKAGNYKISSADTEYGKFAYALKETLAEICKKLARDGKNGVFFCKVSGARSKQAARELAKRIVASDKVRSALLSGDFEAENVLYEVHSVVDALDFSKVRIGILTDGNELVAFEDGRALFVKKENLQKLIYGQEAVLHIELGAGNYSASGTGCL